MPSKSSALTFLFFILYRCLAMAACENIDDFGEIKKINSNLMIVQAFNRTGLECPEKIWPKMTLLDKKILIVNPEAKNSMQLEINQSKFSMIEIPNSKIKGKSQFDSPFSFTNENGKDIEIVKIDRSSHSVGDPNENAFALAYHEAFHRYTQERVESPWPNITGPTSRNEIYPEDWRLIYYRRMEIESLKTSFKKPTNNAGDLCEAKYWHQKAKNEFPERIQLIKYNDIVEGTARYAERRALQIAKSKTGCKASQTQLDQVEINNELPLFFNNIDSQSYAIGAYSGFLLDRLDLTSSWKKQVEAGSPPDEVLFSKISNCSNFKLAEENKIKSEIINEVKKRNSENEKTLGLVEKQWNSKEFVRVAIPSASTQGAFSVKGMYSVVGIKNSTVYDEADMNFQKDGVNIQLTNAMVIKSESDSNPCGASVNIFLVPTSELSSDRKIVFSSSKANGVILNSTRFSDENKNQWICVGK